MNCEIEKMRQQHTDLLVGYSLVKTLRLITLVFGKKKEDILAKVKVLRFFSNVVVEQFEKQ